MAKRMTGIEEMRHKMFLDGSKPTDIIMLEETWIELGKEILDRIPDESPVKTQILAKHIEHIGESKYLLGMKVTTIKHDELFYHSALNKNTLEEGGVVIYSCLPSYLREREVSPQSPSPEKEKLEGAASLESDVLLDNIERAVERRNGADVGSNAIRMNHVTFKNLWDKMEVRLVEDVQRSYLCDLQIQTFPLMKDGEFVILYDERVAP